MKLVKGLAVIALPMLVALGAGQAAAYDNDEQALRLRDTVSDPSVPVVWDRRHHPETWRYKHRGEYRYARGCGRRAYWDGDECVMKRRWR
ncbi:MAG: hypothetical protein ABL907_05765 [Hyphomicrobium sp.]